MTLINTLPRSIKKAIRAFAILLIGMMISAAAFAQDTVMLNFVNADIPSVVKAIGAHTGKNFIIDPRVTGNMNIISQSPVSKDLAYQILLSALRVRCLRRAWLRSA